MLLSDYMSRGQRRKRGNKITAGIIEENPLIEVGGQKIQYTFSS